MMASPDTLRFEGALIGGEPVNRTAIDQFTLLHILSGFALFWIFRAFGFQSALLAFALAVGWEIWEPYAKDWNPDLFPHPSKDSKINKTFDVIGVMLGYYIAVAIAPQRSEF